MALRPFFMVSSTALEISRFALHLTQYPSGIKFSRNTLHASCGYAGAYEPLIQSVKVPLALNRRAVESEPGIMSHGWNTDETRIWPDEFARSVGEPLGDPSAPTQEQQIRVLPVFHPWLHCRFQVKSLDLKKLIYGRRNIVFLAAWLPLSHCARLAAFARAPTRQRGCHQDFQGQRNPVC